MDGYEVKVYFSADDDCYVAEIIEFVGCAADGPTPEAALANLRELKPVWMQAVIANGYAVPRPAGCPLRSGERLPPLNWPGASRKAGDNKKPRCICLAAMPPALSPAS